MFTLGHVNLWTCIFTCMPEGYRKANRSINRSVNRLVRRPVNRPVNRPNRPVNRPLNKRTTEAGVETRPAGRIPEGFHTIVVIWSPGPAWSRVKLRNVHFTCTPEGYRKGNRSSVKALTESHCNFTRTPEGYRKDTGRIPEGRRKCPLRGRD